MQEAAARLGANLRRLREDAGLSQEDAAWATGCTTRHWQRAEAGGVNASLRLLVAMAQALDVDVGELLAPPSDEPRRTPAPNRKQRRGLKPR